MAPSGTIVDHNMFVSENYVLINFKLKLKHVARSVFCGWHDSKVYREYLHAQKVFLDFVNNSSLYIIN